MAFSSANEEYDAALCCAVICTLVNTRFVQSNSLRGSPLEYELQGIANTILSVFSPLDSFINNTCKFATEACVHPLLGGITDLWAETNICSRW